LGLLQFCLLHIPLMCRRYLLPVMPILALFTAIRLERLLPRTCDR
jgi:hypothetical protein